MSKVYPATWLDPLELSKAFVYECPNCSGEGEVKGIDPDGIEFEDECYMCLGAGELAVIGGHQDVET